MTMLRHSFHGIGAVPDHPLAKDAQQRWTDLKSERSQFESDWEDIARLIRPQRGGFRSGDPAHKTTEKPLSSGPIIAQSNLSAGLYGTLTNPANRWFGLSTPDPALNDDQDMREWLDLVASRILRSFSPEVSPFYDAAIQGFSDLCAFGNFVQYDELLTEKRQFVDQTLSLAEVVWDIDGFGAVVEVVRRFALKPRAAVAMFGADALPANLVELAEKNDQSKVWFWHHVLPNSQFLPGRIGANGKAFLSVYACEMGCSLIRVRGFDEMPFDVARWDVDSGYTCGNGPGYIALASARLVNRMDEATIRAAQMAADPVKLAPDRDAWPLNGKLRPGAMIYGGVDVRGNPLIRTMDTHAGIGLTFDEKQRLNDEIKDAFNWSLMNLAGRTGMTATEVITIEEERQRLMAPFTGRTQREYLRPKISRRFSTLWRAGQIPPPPEHARGAPLQVEYLSAAARAQKSRDGAAVMQLLANIGPLAQIKPRLLDRINEDELIETLQEAHGVPAAILYARAGADATGSARAEQQQQMQQMAMAAEAASAAKDAAGAAQAAGLVGGEGGAM